MARDLKPKRLRVMFQPHRYSRTKTLLDEFPPALANADEVVLVPVYPAFEQPIPGGDIADLYLAFRRFLEADSRDGTATGKLLLARDAAEAWRHMYLTAEPGDAIMLPGAGDIIDLVPRILEDMASYGKAGEHPHAGPTQLRDFSFFRTGGVTYGCILHSIPDQSGDTLILGAGSNMWLSDCATDADIVKAPPESGAARPGASLIAEHPELSFMAGIPGTVGGWARMNAGAHGDSFGNHIDHVIADGKRIPAEDCGFGYRTSSIPGLITHVELKSDASASGPSAEHYLSLRKKFPPRTCGSVFKNPSPDMPAGKLLEEAGAKSLKVGGAYVWEDHANVIVAGDGCTSSDILALARLMAARVRERFGVTLVPEIRGLKT
jgi:UDP-N-acetylenolpyruvoylglucosamine reductase